MQIAEFYERFGADGDGYRQPAEKRCHGRVVCVDCPRDHMAPPLLALRLPSHIRLHRARFPNHAIRFWCWTCYEFHPESEDPMTQEYAAVEVALGVCAQDGNVWAVTPDRQNCILCGRPPDRFIPLDAPADVGDQAGDLPTDDGRPLAGVTSFWADCPRCGTYLEAKISPDSFTLVVANAAATTSEAPATVSAGDPSLAEVAGAEHTASLAEPAPGALTESAEAPGDDDQAEAVTA